MSPDVITLSRLDSSVTDENAHWHWDVELTNGPEADILWIAVRTHDVPVGSLVWFHNLDGDISIAIPPTELPEPDFQVGITVQLPANYTCTIRVLVQLNGQVPPPPDATVQLVTYVVNPTDGKAPDTPTLPPSGLHSAVTLRP